MAEFTIDNIKILAKGILWRYISIFAYICVGIFFLAEYKPGIVVSFVLSMFFLNASFVYEIKFIWRVLHGGKEELLSYKHH